jgi:lipid II:glycine glycyltransferase (peptidoglycan interpeptide bridge formation enzyme)
MTVKILPYKITDQNPQGTEGFLTLADNSCLPGIIADSFGWEAVSILSTNDQGESQSFGACRIDRKIVILPHFSYGQFAEPEVATEIIKAIKTEGYSCEWRLTVKASEFCFTDKITTLLPLQDNGRNQLSLLDSNVRRKIRKCGLNGINVKMGKSELLHDFYKIYSRNMHRLGSPALPKRWFAALLSQYTNGDVALWCAYLNNKPVGTAFMLEYNGFYEACWVSTLSQYNRLYTSYGLYWEMIRYASEHKGLTFSFGRSSPDSGVHKFKQQWGGVDVPLFWNYSHPQKGNVRRLTFLPKLWKLLPYPVARFIGPFVSGRFY